MKHVWTRTIISIVCVSLAVCHIVWPKLTVDATTLTLVLVAVLPWLASVLKSIELPGGVKVELQEVKDAADKATGAALAPNKAQSPSTLSRATNTTRQELALIRSPDPNLTLVGIRIDIERRLLILANKFGVPQASAAQMLTGLAERKVLGQRNADGLQQLIALGNKAAHGAEVSESAAQWALEVAPTILGYLDHLTSRTGEAEP